MVRLLGTQSSGLMSKECFGRCDNLCVMIIML